MPDKITEADLKPGAYFEKRGYCFRVDDVRQISLTQPSPIWVFYVKFKGDAAKGRACKMPMAQFISEYNAEAACPPK
jgi:hypothetical protein